MITLKELKENMNQCGASGTPFVFGINYEMDRCFFYPNPHTCEDLYFDINGVTNAHLHPDVTGDEMPIEFTAHPISFEEYAKKFQCAYAGLQRGDSFLLNLTVATPITTNLSLQQIFKRSKAKYKLWIPGEFVCFSPECFVKIKDGVISGFPMKGTIDATLPNAEECILNDYKEQAEHYTIVDLIRNDLNKIGTQTRVERFRYIDRIERMQGPILQVSSEITARLETGFEARLGDLFTDMLPAGSICGAPKAETLRIIANAEQEKRDFYTGVVGYFDGKNLDSGVLIRFIEEKQGEKRFRSGGGITINSKVEDEYREVIEKVYLPF
ncbi:MAG: aminodeoxychorismate synthase component I [Marinifilaceae bacterium]